MVNYDGGRKKKGKGRHFRTYRDDERIESLHILYEERKDNDKDGRYDDDNNGNWENMEEKEREKEGHCSQRRTYVG